MANWQPTIDYINSTILRISSLSAEDLCHYEIVNLIKGIKFFSTNMNNLSKAYTVLAIKWLNLYMSIYEKMSDHKLKEDFCRTVPSAFEHIIEWLYFAEQSEKECEDYLKSILKTLSQLFVTSNQKLRAQMLKGSKKFLTLMWVACLSFCDYSTQNIVFQLTPIVLDSMTPFRRKAELKELQTKFGETFGKSFDNAREFLNELNSSPVLNTCTISFKAVDVTIGTAYNLSKYCQEIWIDVNIFSENITIQIFYKSSSNEDIKEVYLKLKLKDSLFGNKSPVLVLLLDSPILFSEPIEDAPQIEQQDVVIITTTAEQFLYLKENEVKIQKLCKKTVQNEESVTKDKENKSHRSNSEICETENNVILPLSEIESTSNSNIQSEIPSEILCEEESIPQEVSKEINNIQIDCNETENNVSNLTDHNRLRRKRSQKQSYVVIENDSDEENIYPKVKSRKKKRRRKATPRAKEQMEIDILRSDALEPNDQLTTSPHSIAHVVNQTILNQDSSNAAEETFETFNSSETLNMQSSLRYMPQESIAEPAPRIEHELENDLNFNFNWYEARNQHFSGNIEFIKQFGEPMSDSFLKQVGVLFMAAIRTLIDDYQHVTVENSNRSTIIPTVNKLIWMFSVLSCYAESKENYALT